MELKNLIALLSVVLCFNLFAEEKISVFDQGNNAFNKEQFESAIGFYNQELETNPNNLSALFNMGLSYSAQKKHAKAIWAFEKVLRLNPNDAEAIENIQQNYVDLDNSQSWTPPLGRFTRALYSMSSQSWSIISIMFSVLTGLGLILFRRSKALPIKRLYLFASFFTIALMGASIYISAGAFNYEHQDDLGIVTMKQIFTYTGKGENIQKDVFLHEGTHVTIKEHIDTSFLKIETKNGRIFCVKSTDIDRI